MDERTLDCTLLVRTMVHTCLRVGTRRTGEGRAVVQSVWGTNGTPKSNEHLSNIHWSPNCAPWSNSLGSQVLHYPTSSRFARLLFSFFFGMVYRFYDDTPDNDRMIYVLPYQLPCYPLSVNTTIVCSKIT